MTRNWHKWTKREIALIGMMTDKALALRLRRTQYSVRAKRVRLGYGAFRAAHRWTSAETRLALCMELTAGQVAKRLGRSRYSVKAKRDRMGLRNRKH